MQISIIIPTYAPKEYIYDCFSSLSEQTSGINAFEVIVILNGEKEPYYSNIESYLTKHLFKFKLLHTEKKGVSNARNLGLDTIQQNNSHYVLFLDDDDKLSPNFIEQVSQRITPDIVVSSNSKVFFDLEENHLSRDYVSNCYNKNANADYNIFKYRCFLSTVWGKLFPLSVIGNTRFNTNFSIGEDSLFVFEISNKIKKIVLTGHDALYLRRIRPASASRKRRSRLSKFKNGCQLCIAYSKAYLKNPFGYNLLFFISRIIATLIHIIKRDNSATPDRLMRNESQNTLSGN